MKHVSIIYWSGTGNTEKMALAVEEGLKTQGVVGVVINVNKASREDILNADAVALGCPAMGSEVLEEEEMEPFVSSLKGEELGNKPFVLFGSYDWGDGQWMRDWEERMKNYGADLIGEGLILQDAPDEEGLIKCRELGKKLAVALDDSQS